jgi:hypothetical protein
MSHAAKPARLPAAGRPQLARMPALIILVYAVAIPTCSGCGRAWLPARRIRYSPPPVNQRGLYGRIRHPLMAAFVVIFWAAPTMTAGHLLFAATATGSILAGIAFEEHDLVRSLGDTYTAYQARVPALIPWPSLRRHPFDPKKRRKPPEAGNMKNKTVITPAAASAQAGGRAAASARIGMFAPAGLLEQGPETARAFLAQVGKAGIDHVCCGDHVSFAGLGFDGLVQATALAMLHPTLPVYSGVYLLPLRHPVLVARQLADIARLAPGRLIFGAGIGGEDRREVAICGVDYCPYGTAEDVGEFLAPYVAAGCTEFNLIPQAPDHDHAIAGTAAVKRLLAPA